MLNKVVLFEYKKRNKEMKKDFKKIFKNSNVIYTVCCFVIVILFIIIHLLFGVKMDSSDLFDLGLFSTAVLVFIVNSIANNLTNFFVEKFEDVEKMTNDYDKLSQMYAANTILVKHINKTASTQNIIVGRKHTKSKRKEENGVDVYTIPAANAINLQNKLIEIKDDKTKKYQLPEEIRAIQDKLLAAHSYSKIYNQLNIRLDNIQTSNGKVVFECSRTTYFDSLSTNRVLDYKINGITIRDMYAYGPFLSSLKESNLSNHIGFNGLVETEDNYFIFILRHKRVSISKNTLQISVGASLKTKYALNEEMLVTKEGIVNAIKNEIEAELNLDKLDNYKDRREQIFKGFCFDNVHYTYRELVEGGKPQLLFYAKINVPLAELRNAYSFGVSKRIRKKEKTLSVKHDGYKALYLHREKLKEIYITPDGLTIEGKFYKSVPTMTASLSLLLNSIGV